MNRHTTVKKSLILLVAVIMCLAVLLTACNGKTFKRNFDAPKGGEVKSNGGIAVQYGEWIYYVNGYESNANAENTYVNTNDSPRVGSVVRIKAADIPAILAINDDDDLTTTERAKAIAKAVDEKTQIVVPHVYYSTNTTTRSINGIYIFNDRLYMLTPNDKLTAGGSTQTDQSVLMSFDLAGEHPQRHFTFESNSAQIWLYEKEGKVMATYYMNSKLYVLELTDSEKSAVKEITGEEETVAAINYDEAANCLFFLDGDGSICKLDIGAKEKKVIIDNTVGDDGETSSITYAIVSVNAGYVYYTQADSNNSDVDNIVLYYVNTNVDGNYSSEIALHTTELNSKPIGWKDGKVVTIKPDGNYTGLEMITSADCKQRTLLLKPGFNESSISSDNMKIVGDELYYTAGGVMYVKNLNDFDSEEYGTPYGTSALNSTTGGWSTPDRLEVTIDGETHVYVFSLGTGTVSVVEFNAETKKDSTSAAFTKIVIVEEDED